MPLPQVHVHYSHASRAGVGPRTMENYSLAKQHEPTRAMTPKVNFVAACRRREERHSPLASHYARLSWPTALLTSPSVKLRVSTGGRSPIFVFAKASARRAVRIHKAHEITITNAINHPTLA